MADTVNTSSRRPASWWGRLFLAVGIALLLVGSLLLNVVQRVDFNSLKHHIYHQCLHRSVYDQASHDAVVADLDEQRQLYKLFAAQAGKGQNGVSNTSLARIFQEKINRDQASISLGVIRACTPYK